MRLLFETKVEQDIWKHYKLHYKSVSSFGRVLESSDTLDILVSKPWYKMNSGIRFFTGAGYMWLKRLIDIVLSLFFLILIMPVLIACAIAIKIDSPGPVFFVQNRTGFLGKPFKMLKLRTMRRDADKIKRKYAHLNILSWPDFKIPDDPRVTRVGLFLRKTSLDEIPQFVNVLFGDMSMVGPRPTSFSAATYELWHTARLGIKPGITGVWQVSGRNDIEFDERVRMDVAYINNVSLALDLKIMFRTLSAVLRQEGA
jgi:lipopolysaccharide/colanic/teichoic acid biosynthesis glycosyltransferase